MEGIEEQVQIRHRQGWRLHGSLSVNLVRVELSNGRAINKYYQPMIKETPIDYGGAN